MAIKTKTPCAICHKPFAPNGMFGNTDKWVELNGKWCSVHVRCWQGYHQDLERVKEWNKKMGTQE